MARLLLALILGVATAAAVFIDGKGTRNRARTLGKQSSLAEYINAALFGTGGNINQYRETVYSRKHRQSDVSHNFSFTVPKTLTASPTPSTSAVPSHSPAPSHLPSVSATPSPSAAVEEKDSTRTNQSRNLLSAFTPTTVPSRSASPSATPTPSASATPSTQASVIAPSLQTEKTNSINLVQTQSTDRRLPSGSSSGQRASRNSVAFPSPSVSQTAAVSPSRSAHPSTSASPSLSTSPSVSVSPRTISSSPSTSASPSASGSPSVSESPSVSTSPSFTASPSASASSSTSVSPSTSASPSVIAPPSVSASPIVSNSPSFITSTGATSSASRSPYPSVSMSVLPAATKDTSNNTPISPNVAVGSEKSSSVSATPSVSPVVEKKSIEEGKKIVFAQALNSKNPITESKSSPQVQTSPQKPTQQLQDSKKPPVTVADDKEWQKAHSRDLARVGEKAKPKPVSFLKARGKTAPAQKAATQFSKSRKTRKESKTSKRSKPKTFLKLKTAPISTLKSKKAMKKPDPCPKTKAHSTGRKTTANNVRRKPSNLSKSTKKGKPSSGIVSGKKRVSRSKWRKVHKPHGQHLKKKHVKKNFSNKYVSKKPDKMKHKNANRPRQAKDAILKFENKEVSPSPSPPKGAKKKVSSTTPSSSMTPAPRSTNPETPSRPNTSLIKEQTSHKAGSFPILGFHGIDDLDIMSSESPEPSEEAMVSPAVTGILLTSKVSSLTVPGYASNRNRRKSANEMGEEIVPSVEPEESSPEPSEDWYLDAELIIFANGYTSNREFLIDILNGFQKFLSETGTRILTTKRSSSPSGTLLDGNLSASLRKLHAFLSSPSLRHRAASKDILGIVTALQQKIDFGLSTGNREATSEDEEAVKSAVGFLIAILGRSAHSEASPEDDFLLPSPEAIIHPNSFSIALSVSHPSKVNDMGVASFIVSASAKFLQVDPKELTVVSITYPSEVSGERQRNFGLVLQARCSGETECKKARKKYEEFISDGNITTAFLKSDFRGSKAQLKNLDEFNKGPFVPDEDQFFKAEPMTKLQIGLISSAGVVGLCLVALVGTILMRSFRGDSESSFSSNTGPMRDSIRMRWSNALSGDANDSFLVSNFGGRSRSDSEVSPWMADIYPSTFTSLPSGMQRSTLGASGLSSARPPRFPTESNWSASDEERGLPRNETQKDSWVRRT